MFADEPRVELSLASLRQRVRVTLVMVLDIIRLVDAKLVSVAERALTQALSKLRLIPRF